MCRRDPYVLAWDGFIQMLKETGQNAWALQERLKGRLPLGWVLGSNYGGWGFNMQDYLGVYIGVNEALPWGPEAANQLEKDDLKAKPFFKKGTNDNDLFTDTVLPADYISEKRLARLLAEAIPALTLPAGANETSAFGLRNNFNMQDMQVNGWPNVRDKLNWYHSDFKDVAYLYVYELFDQLVEKGVMK